MVLKEYVLTIKQARKLQATLVQNYHRLTHSQEESVELLA